ncbi:hypothetical protein BLNAU_1535 [Blattamonas nauphoetae]|uniref:Uncharacterized protein n=1 Tax=Blattamonas nauphoetae TaxID=2049346 RepID=A0ABQ9YIC8_9EUKA|nr:hypothetical protein BLNAU_21825 [Blattamonas nauphoetae]KAK2963492.1 hypothetical protein BLNAU_1535 [Blattamonas nauphoetae]
MSLNQQHSSTKPNHAKLCGLGSLIWNGIDKCALAYVNTASREEAESRSTHLRKQREINHASRIADRAGALLFRIQPTFAVRIAADVIIPSRIVNQLPPAVQRNLIITISSSTLSHQQPLVQRLHVEGQANLEKVLMNMSPDLFTSRGLLLYCEGEFNAWKNGLEHLLQPSFDAFGLLSLVHNNDILFGEWLCHLQGGIFEVLLKWTTQRFDSFKVIRFEQMQNKAQQSKSLENRKKKIVSCVCISSPTIRSSSVESSSKRLSKEGISTTELVLVDDCFLEGVEFWSFSLRISCDWEECVQTKTNLGLVGPVDSLASEDLRRLPHPSGSITTPFSFLQFFLTTFRHNTMSYRAVIRCVVE